MVTRRVTFKLYPTQQQAAKLFEWRRLHCYLYNACLEHRIVSYRRFGESIGYYDQQNLLPEFKKVWPEYKDLGGHALQATVKRVDFAFQRFFKGLGKYPKFKSIRQYSGWTFPDKQSWKAHTDGQHGRLEIANLGSIRMRGKARTWGLPTTCTVVYRVSEDAWYASITVECNPIRQTGDGAIGIDLGCKDAVSFSDGTKEAKPEFIQVGDIAVKRASKSLRRKRKPNRKARIKASSRWRKGQRKVSQLKRKVANQREDWLHKLTSDIVSRNSLVAGEKLNVKGMTRKAKKGSKRKAQKTGLNRSILSVGFGMVGPMIAYKEAEAGGFYVESPTQQLKPSQRCFVCWELTPKALADRVHHCQHCGHVEDRDTNAAQVNLKWARGQELGLTLSAESAIPTDCGSMRQMAARKRQKLQAVGGNSETPPLYSAG
jgi:putative transposase